MCVSLITEVIVIKNKLIDAVKTAKSIHDGDYSSLRDKSFVIRGKIKKTRDHHPGDNTVKKSRIDRIEESIAKLAEKIDNLGNDLRDEMNTGFKQVNTRIDRIDTRLDYIVKANNLKDNK